MYWRFYHWSTISWLWQLWPICRCKWPQLHCSRLYWWFYSPKIWWCLFSRLCTRGTRNGSTQGSRGVSIHRRSGRSGVSISSTPHGYTTSDHPVLGGPGPCPHYFCSPCVLSNPPSFLVRSSSADVRNANKQYPLQKILEATEGYWTVELWAISCPKICQDTPCWCMRM